MNVLLSCAGRRGYLVDYFREAVSPLGGKVFAANSSELAVALQVADVGFLMPPLISGDYVDSLVDLCLAYDIKLIVPLYDPELVILSQHRQRFSDVGVTILVSDAEVVRICNDKWATKQFLTLHDISTPDTYLGIRMALNALNSGELAFPVVLKPRWGMGSLGLLEANNADELNVLHQQLQSIVAAGVWANAGRVATDTESILVQRKLVGVEYGLDVVNNLSGEYVTTFVRQKLAMRSGETDIATTIDHPHLSQLGKTLGYLLGHVANMDVDVFLDASGQEYVLELNARFGGGYPFSHSAGANLPAAIIAWLRNQTPDPEWLKVTHGITAYKSLQMLVAHKTPVKLS